MPKIGRNVITAGVAALALAGCASSATTTSNPGPSQAQLAAESRWQHGPGGKYLALVSDYLKAINVTALDSFTVASPLATAAALASAFPPPIDANAYAKVMLDYGTASDDLSKNPPNVNRFIAYIDSAGSVLTTVKPPWGASLPGGKNF